ncbi:hypothetical protein [Gracilimonas sp. BCB1]|uniref:hypothetical protein n=1 Tax=Gracilimonas sp. BCB1 TaxID=3152362 RepID=UPI0032D974A4
MKNLIILFTVFTVFISCQPNVEPCKDTYKEPIFSVTGATSTGTTDSLYFVKISNVKIDSLKIDPISLTEEISNNIVVKDSIMECTIPCGFGTKKGLYEFTFSAEGHFDLTITAPVDYRKGDENCPSRNSNGESYVLAMYSKET